MLICSAIASGQAGFRLFVLRVEEIAHMDCDDDWDMEAAIDMERDFDNDMVAFEEMTDGEVESWPCGQEADQASRISLSPASSSSCAASSAPSPSSGPSVSDAPGDLSSTGSTPPVNLPVRHLPIGEPSAPEPSTSNPRKRLRGKTSVSAAPNAERSVEQCVGIWEGCFDIEFAGHRQKYFCFLRN